MILTHHQKTPRIHPSAYVAPNAMLCGDVTVGKNVRIMHGCQIIAESSPVSIGDCCVILENAVIRGTEGFPVKLGKNCLVGPQTHLAGCTVMDNVFIATGASIFHGALIEEDAEVRINGIVHVKSVLKRGMTVPIGWVAVGNPAQLFSPDRHDEIWAIQKTQQFNQSVYGMPADQNRNPMKEICRVMVDRLGSHREDEEVTDS